LELFQGGLKISLVKILFALFFQIKNLHFYGNIPGRNPVKASSFLGIKIISENFPISIGDGFRGLDKLKAVRSTIPAITHVDYSARIQTVDRETSPRYWKIIDAFKKRTGYGVIVNTSFNVRGEPIVCTPEDAYRCFMVTDMDALVLGRHLLLKSEQEATSERQKEAHLARFELD